jgi:hypothetical protein
VTTPPDAQIPYVQPFQNLAANNLKVVDNLLGDGVAMFWVDGDPNGVVPGVLYQLALDGSTGAVWQNTDGDKAWSVFVPAGGSLVERAPMDLQFSTTIPPAALPGFAPENMRTLNDTMTDTTLARFTTYSENAHPITPTIATGHMTLSGPINGTDWNTILVEDSGLSGNGLVVPQFAVSMQITTATGTGNAYQNIGIGIAKDAAHFMGAVWRRVDGLLSIQVNVPGYSAFHADVAFEPAVPFYLGLSLVANTLTAWASTDSVTWTPWTAFALDPSKIDMKAEVLSSGASWKPAIVTASQAVGATSLVLTNFRFGSFGGVGIRDIVPLYSASGVPVVDAAGVVKCLCTFADPNGAAYCAGIEYDLVNRTMEMVSTVWVNRGGKLQNDCAGQFIDDGAGGYHGFITTWGNAGTTADAINVLYKHLTGIDPFAGVITIGTWTQPTLPNVPVDGGTYDPCAAYRASDGLWYLAYTIGPDAVTAYYPALATSPDLSTWTAVAAAQSSQVPYEGTRVIRMAGELWALAGSLANFDVFDVDGFALQGSITCPLQPESGTVFPPHPTCVPYLNHVYLLAFTNTRVAGVSGTEGQPRVYRSPRYMPAS